MPLCQFILRFLSNIRKSAYCDRLLFRLKRQVQKCENMKLFRSAELYYYYLSLCNQCHNYSQLIQRLFSINCC